MRKKCTYAWSGVCIEDIAHYLGIVMWMVIIGLPEMRMYWTRNMTFSLSVFPQMMPRRSFEAIQKYFHSFNRRAILKGNPDKLMIIRPVLDFIIGKCRSLYVPLRNLSINEGMLKWKGRLSIRVCIPLKPIKYGIKFYFLCKAKTGYVLDCIIYRGVMLTLRNIVFNLLGRHLGHGYHVFMDNYYTSVALAEELYDYKTHVSGMLRLPQGAPQVLAEQGKVKKLGPWGDGVPQEEQHHGSHLAGHTIGVVCQHRRFHPQTKGEKEEGDSSTKKWRCSSRNSSENT